MSNLEKSINIMELLKDGNHYTEKRGSRIHIINALTGKTISMQQDITPGVPEKLELITLEDGTEVWVDNNLAKHVTSTCDVLFSPIIIDLLCQRIVEGGNITALCGTESFPSYVTLCKWKRAHPWIDDALEKAKVDRADFYRDQVMKEAYEAESMKDPIHATNVRIDAYKWASAIDNPAKYSPRAKMEATINMPTQIIVDTGIVREAPVIAVEELDESK